MMEEKELVPKRRFEAFKNKKSWRKFILGDHAIIKGRLGWKSLKREEYLDSGPKMIAGRHIKDGVINWSEVDHIPLWRYEESPEIMLKNNDVIFSKDGSLGNPALITNLEGKATINATMMLVRTNQNLDSRYFYQILNSKYFLDLIKLKVSGSSIPHLFQEDMKKFSFYAPKINEQQKIGEFFKHLDEMIALQQKKIDKTKALKSAYLAEMFPAEGERVPKRRFAGFTDEWNVIKLSEIADIVGGGTPNTSNSNYWNGDINWFTPSEIGDRVYAKESLRTITKLGLEQSSARILPPNKTILFTSRAGIGSMAILAKQGTTNQGFQSIVLKNNVDTYFIYSMGYLIKRYAFINASGSTFLEISGESLGNMKLLLPSNQEQEKIGQFFKNLDDIIFNHQQKLDKLKATKQAYLNEMFV